MGGVVALEELSDKKQVEKPQHHARTYDDALSFVEEDAPYGSTHDHDDGDSPKDAVGYLEINFHIPMIIACS